MPGNALWEVSLTPPPLFSSLGCRIRGRKATEEALCFSLHYQSRESLKGRSGWGEKRNNETCSHPIPLN